MRPSWPASCAWCCILKYKVRPYSSTRVPLSTLRAYLAINAASTRVIPDYGCIIIINIQYVEYVNFELFWIIKFWIIKKTHHCTKVRACLQN